MQLERRSVFGWGATAAGSASCHLGLVIHYDGSNQGLAGKSHSACRTYWKNTRRFHMGPSRGWADLGYSFGVCTHGIVMEGRGARRAQAAQPGGNTTWTSCTLMTGPSEDPTPAQIEGVRQLRAWLRKTYGMGAAVRGHRNFISTSCPGDRAYKLVTNGTFTKAPGSGGVPSTSEENPLIGLKEGDEGEGVVAVQRYIDHCGFGDLLGSSGVDGKWGPATSKGLLALRKSLGSSVTVANSVTGSAYQQMQRALARREAEKLLADLKPGAGGAVDASDLVGKTVTSKITEVR
jgi:hypothetical protein